MMYVESRDEIRQFILDGTSAARAGSTSVQREREKAAIQMPAYRDLVSTREVEELTAAFMVLAGMAQPATGTVADQGLELARRWECFACHGAGGSGGLPNPGSYPGFIPGWYGADYRDLVRNREEFDSWVLEGTTPRLAKNRMARFFVERQRLQMPAYRNLSAAELDALWAYFRWLGETDGGLAKLLD